MRLPVGEARMSRTILEANQSDGHRALIHLENALQILDEIDAPAHIGAHVDLAICELRDALKSEPHSKGSGD